MRSLRDQVACRPIKSQKRWDFFLNYFKGDKNREMKREGEISRLLRPQQVVK